MADSIKDLQYLRFYYSSEESLKDKDILKNQAFEKYTWNTSMLFMIPAALQVAQISQLNRPSRVPIYKYLRHLKIFSLFGGIACAFNEKLLMEKKWRYYDHFYPEPTQLQKTLVQDAQIQKIREEAGLGEQEESLEEQQNLDPETTKVYEQMYQLPPQRFVEAERDWNPAVIKNHWGSS